ncbi:Uncharacterized protein PECH_008502 [Penicillium ucsense]|uniref:Phosphoglycerate dehydrogenase n=1 Tax=Penicillium ucsense TaxID=2839758 RepID=A0A8J8WGV6_9EURO|nr:Uncharacterized protein PECM_006402 [Penicillium ucsense]KAF7734109.1 Uncharacterized protein PECH_008502 [Penicillium ucsense]
MSSSQRKRQQVLVLGDIHESAVQYLGEFMTTVHPSTVLAEHELLRLVPDFDALIVRSDTKVTGALLQAGRKLKVVARAGVGVDNIDVQEATRLGILVVNEPAGNVAAAAEHTIALMMTLARQIHVANNHVKSGGWHRSRFEGVQIRGKVLGIVGFGKGKSLVVPWYSLVAQLAKGLGMRVIAYDPYVATHAAKEIERFDDLTMLLPQVDFLTIHAPLNESTQGIIGARELAKMKPGSRILNVSRGGTIDEDALLASLESGHLAGAALDVFCNEPPRADSTSAKLIAHMHVVATPHIGAITAEALETTSWLICQEVIDILVKGMPARNSVNATRSSIEEHDMIEPFVRLAEQMGMWYAQRFPRSVCRNMATTTFELRYRGCLGTIDNTKPLFAGFIKGLLGPRSGPHGRPVSVVNADIVARERGVVVREVLNCVPDGQTWHTDSVTLVARSSPTASTRIHGVVEPCDNCTEGFTPDMDKRQVPCHCCPTIVCLDRFKTQIVPDGNLLLCEYEDEPAMIEMVEDFLSDMKIKVNETTVYSVCPDLNLHQEMEIDKSDEDDSVLDPTDQDESTDSEDDTPFLGQMKLMVMKTDCEVPARVAELLTVVHGLPDAYVLRF